MKVERPWRVAFGLIAALVVRAATADERPVPDEPEEQFTILVLTEEPDDREAKVPLSKVTEEVAKRIKDRKKWFLVSKRPDRAELTVEVMNHALEERMRTRMEYRVDATGTNKELVDITWNEEHHFIEARIHLLGGHQTLLTGADERERGGSLKGAASDLAEKLEALVKEQYWDLVARRVRSP
ncbi:MAG TPA: hypothetical protein VEK15_27610 [Vicinamibacteria bacterium]|nr:hypothetical protein [Vicinamibacteria bacterium]